MRPRVHGLHHVTAIAGDPQENLDFYTSALGLRLVKKSVNQDAPDTYHLFYADGAGTPGTDLTFFPWPRLAPARAGVGLTIEVLFAIPAAAAAYWRRRLEDHGALPDDVETRFGERVHAFRDPHGLRLGLAEIEEERSFVPYEESPVPVEHQLRGLHAVRLWERQIEPTAALLEDVLGLVALGAEEGWHRFGTGAGSGGLVEIREMPDERRGAWGTGGVHHVAWRVVDDSEEMALREAIRATGLRPTQQIDRFWFRSVYFLEPGGALFELATEGPGFDRDEPLAGLGERLILPPWLESSRASIEAALPPLRPTAPQVR